MKKKILGLCLIGLWAFNLSAQSPTISFGKPYRKGIFNGLSQIVGFDNNGFYAQNGKALSRKVVLQKFDRNLNSVEEMVLNKKDKENRSYSSIISFPNQKYALYLNRNDHENDRFELYASPLDTKKMVVSSEEKTLYSIPIEKEYENKYEGYGKVISRDSSKMALLIELPNKSRREPNKYMFKVFTDELFPLWEQSHTFPIADRFFQMEAMRVTDDGNLFCLGRVDTKFWVNKREGTPSYSYHIYYVSPNEDKPVDIPVTISNHFITDITMEIAANGDILCGGFYSPANTFNVKGVFSLTIDGVTKKIKQQAIKEIPLETMMQNMTNGQKNRMQRRERKGKNVELFNYDLHDLVLKEDGGFVLIGEQYYVTVYTTYNRYGSTTHYVYHYNDIIAVNVNPKGDILWAEKIGKIQTSTDDGGFLSSYTMMVQDDKLHFIFNDHKKNVNYKQGGRQQIPKACRPGGLNRATLMVTLDKDGKESREIIMNKKETRIPFIPKFSTQISAKDHILYFHRGSKRRFAKLTFE